MRLHYFVLIFLNLLENIQSNKTLIITHVIFRHGNKAPDVATMYPSNELKNSTFYPFGSSQLTLKGKKVMFNLGKLLKKRYQQFLGQFEPEMLEALSSDYARTRISLQLVLAGLFSNGSNWKPIDYDYIPKSDDKIIGPQNCPPLLSLANINEVEQHMELFDYLSRYTGAKIVSKIQVLVIYDALVCQEDGDYGVPEWVKPIWPEPISTVAYSYYKMLHGVNNLMNYAVGNLLKKIITDTYNKLNSTKRASNQKKLVLYSAHDLTIICLHAVLEKMDGIYAKYASYISIEIHNIAGGHFVKVMYENYVDQDAKVLDIKGCGYLCPLDKFAELMSNYFPTNWCPYDSILKDGYYLNSLFN